MGEKLYKKDFACDFYVSCYRVLSPGNQDTSTMAECYCACGGVYAVNFDSAFFQEVLDKIYFGKMRQSNTTFFEFVDFPPE